VVEIFAKSFLYVPVLIKIVEKNVGQYNVLASISECYAKYFWKRTKTVQQTEPKIEWSIKLLCQVFTIVVVIKT
jgi:hypothetical protein